VSSACEIGGTGRLEIAPETSPQREHRFDAPVERADARRAETAAVNRLVLIQPDLQHRAEKNVLAAGVPRRQVLPWVAAARTGGDRGI